MQVAILAGDFLLARASVSLAALRNTEVIELLSQVIEHLVSGEILQARPCPPSCCSFGSATALYLLNRQGVFKVDVCRVERSWTLSNTLHSTRRDLFSGVVLSSAAAHTCQVSAYVINVH